MYTHILHIDTETTGLSLKNALVWEIGAMLVDVNKFQPQEYFNVAWPMRDSLWDSNTLAFAYKTYGDKLMQEITRPTQLLSGDSNEQAVAGMRRFLHWLQERVVGLHGKDKVAIVMNHVEFDLSCLLNTARYLHMQVDDRLGMGYRNFYDLASLCRGASMGNYDITYQAFKAHQKAQNLEVKHRALEDCVGQNAMLEFFNVRIG